MPVVFFYGGLINPRLRERLGVAPRSQTSATLHDYALTISPWVNVRPESGSTVFGTLMELSHAELAAIYAKLAVRYEPQAVSVRTAAGETMAALCYVAGPMTPGPATREHVMPLLEAAEELHFPAWYVDRIRSFLPAEQEPEHP